MKIRNNYVSNSSSSSFIIKKSDVFNVTSNDIKDFIFANLKPSFNKLLKDNIDFAKKYFHEEFTDIHPIFCVFDLTNKLQKTEAIIELKDYLDGWNIAHSYKKKDGTIAFNKSLKGNCTNYDALLSPNASIAVHFGENDIYDIDGMQDDKLNYMDTDEFTFERFCELFVNWMKANNRVPSDYQWQTFFNDTLAYNMHEG